MTITLNKSLIDFSPTVEMTIYPSLKTYSNIFLSN
jgi:hypothetical protein